MIEGLPPRTAADAARAVLLDQLSAFEAALPAVQEGSQAEALHDLRVALRRGRTVLSQFDGVLGVDAAAELRRELARLARATGPVRDLDVYLAQLADHVVAVPTALRSPVEPLQAFARRRREVARAALREVLDSHRTKAALTAWQRLVQGPGSGPGHSACAEAAAAAGTRVARRYAKVMAHRERLQHETSPQRLHALRKSAKKLRYLLELVAGVQPSADADKLIDRLKRLQDALGRQHDLHVHGEITLQLAEELAAAGGAGPRTLLAAGALAQVMRDEERRCARECLHTLERMGRAKTRRRVARISGIGA